ncbi:MAG: helical backbone metal receptor [Deltaproteobacteria bacterium]|nr:helical backbone metal receptor [Deltaproteobacteria bacterium]
MIKRALVILILLLTLLTAESQADKAQKAQRIVSLAPSVTETLYALGLANNIVGVTDFCNYPEDAKQKPKIGGMANPSLEAIIRAKPDVVVLTEDGNPKEIKTRLDSLGIRTVVIKARRLNELPGEIRRLGKALGAETAAARLTTALELRIHELEKKTSRRGPKKTAIFIVWPEPVMTAGANTLLNDAMISLGLDNIAKNAKTNYPVFSIEEIIRSSPDIIIIGRGSENIEEMSKGLLKKLASTKAVKEGRVYYAPESLLRLTPRAIDGMEELDKMIHAKEGR